MKIIHIDQLHAHLNGPGLDPGGKLIVIFVNEITFFKLLNQYPVKFNRTLRDVTLNGFKVVTDKLIAENHCWLCTRDQRQKQAHFMFSPELLAREKHVLDTFKNAYKKLSENPDFDGMNDEIIEPI